MTVYYSKITALIDPEQSEPIAGGGRWQDISVILIDEHDNDTRRPAAIALPAEDARELAFDLLILAEHAERERTVDL